MQADPFEIDTVTKDVISRYSKDAEVKQQQYIMHKADTDKIFQIVRRFLAGLPVIVYGGTALNELLIPFGNEFYDPTKQIPDYDVYSATPLTHAKQLADKLYQNGFKYTSARNGLHSGTYKVFCNFVPIVDFSLMSRAIFPEVDAYKGSYGIIYAGPIFLRIDMYRELSEPLNQPARWSKVYERLRKVEQFFPMEIVKPPATADSRFSYDLQRQVIKFLTQSDVLVFGMMAAYLYEQFLANPSFASVVNPADVGNTALQVLSTSPEEDAQKVYQFLLRKGVGVSPVVTTPPLWTYSGPSKTIQLNGDPFIQIHDATDHCLSSQTVFGVQVPSLSGLIELFLTQYFSYPKDPLRNLTLFVISQLVTLVNHHQHGSELITRPYQTLSLECFGKPRTMLELQERLWQQHNQRLLARLQGVPPEKHRWLDYRPADVALRRELRGKQ